jgi:transcriptional regulator with XRE-family HTH domain
MIIGDRLREMREQKSLSQSDIERRTGLLRCYICLNPRELMKASQ